MGAFSLIVVINLLYRRIMSLLSHIRSKALRPCYTSIFSAPQGHQIPPVSTCLPMLTFRAVTSDSSGMDPNVQKIAKNEKIDFWNKNKDKGRPISPHMQIYSWQYTNSLSITHRATNYDLRWASCFSSALPFSTLHVPSIHKVP